jgi:hypothetical protein
MTIDKLKPLYTTIFTRLLNKAAEDGSVMIDNGVWLCSTEQMLEEQRDDSLSNDSKGVDFTTAAYWVTTDNKATPEAIDTLDDLCKHPLSDQWIEFATGKRITELSALSADDISRMI